MVCPSLVEESYFPSGETSTVPSHCPPFSFVQCFPSEVVQCPLGSTTSLTLPSWSYLNARKTPLASIVVITCLPSLMTTDPSSFVTTGGNCASAGGDVCGPFGDPSIGLPIVPS